MDSNVTFKRTNNAGFSGTQVQLAVFKKETATDAVEVFSEMLLCAK
jgi:hypothetical protein